jgi:hypothetical protein
LIEDPEDPGTGLDVSVTVESASGEPLRTFSHRGTTYVLGRVGEAYQLRIANHTDQRLEAVLSIDGRDAVSGDVADYVRHRGYLLQAQGSVTIRGFRQSLDRVAEFRFTDPSNSYSARRGTPQHVGIIGVALFTEREPPRDQAWAPPYRDYPDRYYRDGTRDDVPRSSPQPFPSNSPNASGHKRASAGAAEPRAMSPGHAESRSERSRSEGSSGNLGTEYGQSRWSQAIQVPFVRETPSTPARIVEMRYDDAQSLAALGIPVFQDPCCTERFNHRVRDYPDAFPATRFAPPP